MFQKSASRKSPAEARDAKREPMIGITAMVRTARGIVVEGVVQDVSDGGLGITGECNGLHTGDDVEVVLVIRGEKVGYLGQIRHLDESGSSYGIKFASGPFRGDQKRETTKECRACKKDYPDEHTFCFRCGQRLIGGHRAHRAPAGPGKMLNAEPI